MNAFFARVLSLAALPVVLAAAATDVSTTPPEELHRGVEYRGAAAFFSLGSITVVYPAGAGEPVELNRRSADARARWLVSVHKAKAVVAADDQVTEEQKKGNLLLLGWNNRVFGQEGLARPFTHGQEGTVFLGLREPDRSLDLLVYHRNPLNWSSYVLFWSRIDPERDRFQVLPRVGSDWALYRDFGAVRLGMFLPARVWPPTRDSAAEGEPAKEDVVRPGGTATFDSDHYHVVFDRARFKDAEVRAIAAARETALRKAQAAIGPAPDGFRVQLYLYEDENGKREATGVGDPTHTVPAGRELHETRRYAVSSAPREEIHLLAREAYGPCFLTAVYEGLAISVENSLRGDDIELHAARMRAAGDLPPLADVLDEERFRSLPDDFRAAAAGVFMTFLRQTYGPAGVKKAYGLSEGRPALLAAALSVSEEALSASFAAWADARVAARQKDLDFIAAEAEAQQRQVAGDWAGMVAALRKGLRARPGDLQTLFNLASAQMRANDLDGAEASLKELLQAPLPPDGSRFGLFGHYQLGRVYDLTGRRAKALAEYDAVLALPNEFGAHELARQRKTSPAKRDDLE